jgi:hypothetical protein
MKNECNLARHLLYTVWWWRSVETCSSINCTKSLVIYTFIVVHLLFVIKITKLKEKLFRLRGSFKQVISSQLLFLFKRPMKMEQSVPKRRHIKFRCRGITQKKEYSIVGLFDRHFYPYIFFSFSVLVCIATRLQDGRFRVRILARTCSPAVGVHPAS